MISLSRRMEAVTELAGKGICAADVGCDHGLVSMALVSRGRFERVIAMDINEGPLSAARENISTEGLSDRIELRLSDGLTALEAGEADTVIIAGMGGELMSRILMSCQEKARAAALVLEPQSELRAFRRFLSEEGYAVTDELMVKEEGKFYPVIRAVYGGRTETEEPYLSFGRKLLESGSGVLKEYLLKEKNRYTVILGGLPEGAEDRRLEVQEELKPIEAALKLME